MQAADNDVRLSRTLVPDEYAAAGLGQLNSDQVAVLDALVRRDIAAAERAVKTKETRAENFSARLTDDERKNAGLTALSKDQVAYIDAYVARLSPTEAGGSGQFVAGARDESGAVVTRDLKRAPEIHGSVSLMYGAGRGGYSERGGSMVLTYEDPSGIALAFGYSEIRTKGGYLRRGCREPYRDFVGIPPW
jgi:hypothetical protein